MKIDFLDEKQQSDIRIFLGYYKIGNILYKQALSRFVRNSSFCETIIENLLSEGYIKEVRKDVCATCFEPFIIDGECEICGNKGIIEKSHYVVLKVIVC